MQQYALPAAKVVLVVAYLWLVYNFIPVGFVFALFSLAFAVLYTVVLDQLIKRLPVAKFKPSVPLHEWPKSCALVRSYLPCSCYFCDFDLLNRTAIYHSCWSGRSREHLVAWGTSTPSCWQLTVTTWCS